MIGHSAVNCAQRIVKNVNVSIGVNGSCPTKHKAHIKKNYLFKLKWSLKLHAYSCALAATQIDTFLADKSIFAVLQKLKVL
jgi:hypothetical protein